MFLHRARVLAALLCSVGLAALSSSPAAALTAYPDVSGFGFDVTGLQEETNTAGDPTPIFGLPTLSGANLIWSPINFTSSASGGASDQTAGTFQGMVELQNKNLQLFQQIKLIELGDYSLTGSGTNATSASVLAGLAITILEVNLNGVLTPTALPTIDSFFFSWDTPAQGGSWVGMADVDIQGTVDLFYANAWATKISFTFDNELATTSEANSTAFIQKKTAVESVTLALVPEPATGLLLGLGLAGLALRPRRRA